MKKICVEDKELAMHILIETLYPLNYARKHKDKIHLLIERCSSCEKHKDAKKDTINKWELFRKFALN
jgi:hypothetical protein